MTKKDVKHIPKRIFTDDEKQYIIENWGLISIYKMKNKLHCSWDAVANYGKEKGLQMPVQTHIKWDDEEIQELKDLAPKLHYKKIAKRLGRSSEAVYTMGCKLGITLIQDNRWWTLEEIEYLRENWGYAKVEVLAKHLRRSVSSINTKALELGLGPAIKSDIELILVSDICEMLEISKERVVSTFVNHGLFLRKKWISKKRFYYYVLYDDLINYLKNNQDTWDSRNLELYALGMEEDWLKEKRKNDAKNDPYWHKEWTTDEIQKAIDIFNYKKSYQAVAEELHRSLGAVKTVLRQNGLSYSLPRFWKSAEIKFLRDNYQTMTYKEIGDILNRTEKSVAKMARTLGYKKKTYNNSFGYRLWTDDEIEQLRELANMYSLTNIAKKLKRTKDAVERQMKLLGISINSTDRLWSQEEEEKLKGLWKTCGVAQISRILERPISIIRQKAQSMNLGLNRGDEILVTDICSILNVSRGMVVKRYLELGLPVNQNTTSGGKVYYTVKVYDLIEFLRNNQNVWDASNLKIGALGEEWDWLKDKRQRDMDNNNAWKRIMSEEEYALIFSMFQNSIAPLDIADKLNKPYDLIACLLGVDKRLNCWHISEIVFLIENYDKLSFIEIGSIIDRTEKAVKTKAANLGLIKRELIRERIKTSEQ